MSIKINGLTRQFFALVLFVLICCALAQGYKALNYYRLRRNLKETTTPLSQNTIDILCVNFELGKDNKLCNGESDIYGPDFYDLILDTFKPKLIYRTANDVPSTYEEVEKMIGEFKIECEPMVWYEYEQKHSYRCNYDLRGDRKYILHIIYDYPDNTVYDIIARKGKEPHD